MSHTITIISIGQGDWRLAIGAYVLRRRNRHLSWVLRDRQAALVAHLIGVQQAEAMVLEIGERHRELQRHGRKVRLQLLERDVVFAEEVRDPAHM